MNSPILGLHHVTAIAGAPRANVRFDAGVLGLRLITRTVNFELATDTAGFTVDETVDELGTALRLPPWLELARDRVQQALPPLEEPRRPRAGEAA